MGLKLKTKSLFPLVILFNLCVTFNIFIDENFRNYLLIYSLSPIILFSLINIKKLKHIYELTLILITFVSPLFHIFILNTGYDILTFLNTVFLSLSYFSFTKLLIDKNLNLKYYLTILRIIIFSFALMSLVQLLCDLLGIPIPNLISVRHIFSYNSLAIEPSHTGKIISLTFISYIYLIKTFNKFNNFKDKINIERLVIVSTIIVILLCGGVSSLINLLFIAFFLIDQDKFIYFALFLIFFIFLLFLNNNENIVRIYEFVSSLLTFNRDNILNLAQNDLSTTARILPLFDYFNNARTTFDFLFGTGVSYITTSSIIGLYDVNVIGGFIPGYLITNGLFSFIYFIYVFFLRLFKNINLKLLITFIALYSYTGYNVPHFWYALLILRSTSYFINSIKSSKTLKI